MSTFRPESDKLPEMPRLGLNMQISPQFGNITVSRTRTMGELLGPQHGCAWSGLYTTTADSLFTPYVRPQENGYRTDVNWFTLTGNEEQACCSPACPPSVSAPSSIHMMT